jgi:hypothetical protein
MKEVKSLLDVACIILAFSAFIDSALWLTIAYTIPCWTITAMCIGVIMLIQVIKKEMASETVKNPRKGGESARSDFDHQQLDEDTRI